MYTDIMTKALYIHGFGSLFQPESEKMQALASEFDLVGVNVDYTEGFYAVGQIVRDAIVEFKPDILIGTSMGGYTAQSLGAKLGMPYVSINPATHPYYTLQGRVPEVVRPEYAYNATFDGAGMVILDMGDEVLDSEFTLDMLPATCHVKTFEGGNHRFAHMSEAVHDIKKFYNMVFSSYA